ncbi:hypothetical protein HGRIS_002871 [Hohenbuehelia grisea]|uniref:DUF6729 domain-containing protein n=1 Tax=Hohenbuehelia grisea TaxID=104357 RepID=A0ABR3JMK4_9AGAR
MLKILTGYNSNPIARRVRSLHSDYFLLTNRYRCPETAIAEAGCGASFQGSDPVILAQLPRHIQQAFPAYLTARSAIDKPLVALMQPLFAGRFGPDPLASTLAEMRHLRHAELELTYLAAASHQKITDPPSFSEFSDKSAYAGTQPSVQFCKSVFVDYSRAFQTFYDRVVASLPGLILKGDHTFKITKYMARLGSQPTHTAFYTVLNEDEQIRGQALTLTKSLSLVRDMYAGIERGLKDHGHPPTEYMWTDSAAGELSFHELATTSLNENVAHIEADPYTHLPAFHLPPNPFRVVCYETATTIDSACYSILSLLPEHDSSQIVLGFDVKFDSATPSAIAALSGPAPRVHVIQIAYGDSAYVMKVSMFRDGSEVPPNLRSIILSRRCIKVGKAIGANLSRIFRAWSLTEPSTESDSRPESPQQVTNFIDLDEFAQLKGRSKRPAKNLVHLTAIVLRQHLTPPPDLYRHSWSADHLVMSQRTFAALEAYASWKSLSSLPSVGLSLDKTNLIVGQPVSLYSGKKVVAHGSVVIQPLDLNVACKNEEPRRMKNTQCRIVIEIHDILVPGHIASYHNRTLSDLKVAASQPNFCIMASLRCVRTRSSQPPSNIPPPNETSTESPRSYDPEVPMPTLGVLPQAADEGLPCSDSNEDSETDSEDEADNNITGSVNDNSGEDDGAQMAGFGAFSDVVGDIAQVAGSTSNNDSDPEYSRMDSIIASIDLNDPLLIQPSATTSPLPSRLFDDLFHVQNRLLRTLSKTHSAFKAFARAFSEVVLVPDKSDENLVKAFYAHQNIPWNIALKSKADSIHRRVRRYCPPPDRLVPDLQKLFAGWADV